MPCQSVIFFKCIRYSRLLHITVFAIHQTGYLYFFLKKRERQREIENVNPQETTSDLEERQKLNDPETAVREYHKNKKE